MGAAQPAKHPQKQPGVPPFALAAFARDPVRSHGDPRSENALVHGENLDAMRRLARAGFAGRFRCIYLDPPFNSGRRFAEYDDALSPEAWRAMMGERLEAARELLAEDGAIFVEIDDTELGPLQVLLDELYGREQRVSTITVVRSAATGHKAINRGPVNVTDFVLVYARERARWRCNPLVRERSSYDRAYRHVAREPAGRVRVVALLSARGARASRPRRRGGTAAGRALRGAARRARRALRPATVRRRSARARGPRSSIARGASPSASFASSATGERTSSCAPGTASSFWPTR